MASTNVKVRSEAIAWLEEPPGQRRVPGAVQRPVPHRRSRRPSARRRAVPPPPQERSSTSSRQSGRVMRLARGQGLRLRDPCRSASPPESRPRTPSAIKKKLPRSSGRSSKRSAPTTSASPPRSTRSTSTSRSSKVNGSSGSDSAMADRRPCGPRRHHRSLRPPNQPKAGQLELPGPSASGATPSTPASSRRSATVKLHGQLGRRHQPRSPPPRRARIRATPHTSRPELRGRRPLRRRSCTALRDNLNDAVTRDDAIGMLSQHLITRPVFEALFGGDRVHPPANPVSQVMHTMIATLDAANLGAETASPRRVLQPHPHAHRRHRHPRRPPDASSPSSTNSSSRRPSPRPPSTRDRLHPMIEVVDFINRAVNDAPRASTSTAPTISDEGVHVLDPFTGTGTFIARLLQSGLIRPDDLGPQVHQLRTARQRD
jgi:hypothetical protein